MEEGWKSIWLITIPGRESRKKMAKECYLEKKISVNFSELVSTEFANNRLSLVTERCASGKASVLRERMG